MVHLLESGLDQPNNDSTGQLPICLSKLIPRVSETRFADRPCWQERAHVRTQIAHFPAMEVAATRSQRSSDPEGIAPLSVIAMHRCHPLIGKQCRWFHNAIGYDAPFFMIHRM